MNILALVWLKLWGPVFGHVHSLIIGFVQVTWLACYDPLIVVSVQGCGIPTTSGSSVHKWQNAHLPGTPWFQNKWDWRGSTQHYICEDPLIFLDRCRLTNGYKWIKVLIMNIGKGLQNGIPSSKWCSVEHGNYCVARVVRTLYRWMLIQLHGSTTCYWTSTYCCDLHILLQPIEKSKFRSIRWRARKFHRHTMRSDKYRTW